MTVREMIKELSTYKEMPIIMHLGDTLESADASIGIVGVVPYCQLQKELVSELLDDDSPQKKCSECYERTEGKCEIGRKGTGENMIDVLLIAGDW